VLREDDDRSTREWAAVALGEIGDTAAYPALVALLDDDTVTTRRSAALALGRLGEPAAIPLIAAASRRERFFRRKHYRAALDLLRGGGNTSA
jgi:HEAT repeat protein